MKMINLRYPVGGNMKKWLLLLSSFAVLTAATIEYPIKTEKVLYDLEMPGKPVLKKVDLTFLLPANVDPTSISLRVKGDTTFQTGISLSVGRPFVVNGENYWAGVDSLYNGKDQSVYGRDAFFPENHIASYSIGKMRAYNLLKVTLCPSAFNPKSAVLRTLKKSKLEVQYEEVDLRGAIQPAPEKITKLISTTVENYEQFADTYAEPTRNMGTYLVLTSESMKNSLASLDEFTRVKKAKGYNVEVVTEDTWGGGEGETAAIRIREWLQQNYEAKGVEYVLFIGNPSEGAVPMKFCYPDFSGRYKCYVDFFYSDLTGDWDVNKDGKYGMWKLGSSGDNQPGGCDQFAEIFVGRIPYYGNINETEKILQKLIKYETENAADVAWRNNVYLPLNAFESMDGSQLGRALMSKVFTPAGNNVTTLFDRQCSIDKTIQMWNSGNYGIVTWQGHGLDDYTEKIMYSHRTPELSDEYPAHVYQISCHNGKPQNSKNLGYAVFKNAAVSTVSSAVQVLYSASMKELGTSASARHWAYMYDKGLVLDSLSSGESQAQAKSKLKITFDTDWLNAFEMNLYGCPEIGLYSYGVIPTRVVTKTQQVKSKAAIVTNKNSLHVKGETGARVKIYAMNGKLLLNKSMDSAELSLYTGDFGQGLFIVEVIRGKSRLLKQRIQL